jgi:threonine synthase
MRFVTHLESALDGRRFDASQIKTMHQSRPLWVRYDLDRVKYEWERQPLAERRMDMWRYRELLPIGNDIAPVSLGKMASPLIACPRLAARLGIKNLLIKDESQLPTGSFKCRGLSMAVTMAKHFGLQRLAMSSNGNAASALAMYAARGGLESLALMPRDVNRGNLFECWVSGAKVYLADGLIDECGKLIRQGHEQGHWFDVSTLKEPYRLEGKKTMGLEIAEQLDWQLPDVILYSTGGGTALLGMWKAFVELRQMGLLRSSTMPRMIAVQSNGCCPIVTAYEKGERFAQRHQNAHCAAFGIRVPQAIGDFMIMDAIHESHGCAQVIEENDLQRFQQLGCSSEGLSVGLETSASLAAVSRLLDRGLMRVDEKILIINTAASTKYWAESMPEFPTIDLKAPGDLGTLFGESNGVAAPAARRVRPQIPIANTESA